MTLIIEEVKGSVAKKLWNEYVEKSSNSTVFHRYEWGEAIAATYGSDYIYIVAKYDGVICGILPLGRSKSLLFGDFLSSVPFGVYGGILADDTEVEAALDTYACKIADELKVDYLELRNRGSGETTKPTRDIYVTFRKEISESSDENLKSIPRKQRAVVRKGINAGLFFSISKDVDTFFRLYSESVRNLGTPVFSKDLFKNLIRIFPDDCFILTVYKDDLALSSVLVFTFKGEVIPYYGGGSHLARQFHANDFMYWRLMEWAGNNGFHTFDFGRSKIGTGAFSFKKNWGFTAEPLRYEYHLVKKHSIPDKSPLNPKIKPFIEVWKRMPLSITNVIGPFVSRSLG